MKTGIIYIIKNKINKKVYIGQTTTTLQTRFSQHCKNSTIKSRHYKLYNAIKKYGKNNFYIETLETNIPLEELNIKEIYYIEKYNSFKKGYNSTKGGDGRTINKDYDEKNIVSLYKSGKSMVEISKIYNVSDATISRVLKRLNIKINVGKTYLINKNEFINFWENKNIKIKEMANIYKIDEKTVRRFAKKLKLNRKGVSTIEKI